MPESNPIVEVYKGVEIRKYHRITLRVDYITMKELIDAQESTGLSLRVILGLSSRPCDKCKDIAVRAYNKDEESVEIKRGYLSKRIPNKHD